MKIEDVMIRITKIENAISQLQSQNEISTDSIKNLKAAIEELDEQVAQIRQDTVLLREAVAEGGRREELAALIREHFKEWDVGIEEMDLSVRAYNCLKKANYNKVRDLAGVTVGTLMRMHNMGKKSMLDVVGRLKEYGIEVHNDTDIYIG